MKERYEPNEIEPRWQAVWAENRVFSRHREGRPKRYVVEMLPYPSGALHMGHVRNYLIGDVLARFWRMRGFNVIHPMGWDALGLPAENAAIKDQRHPAERTAENVESFKAEMQRLGFSYDWEREISTSDPAYYRWNQWFFLEFKKRGLVYKRHASVNWCTGCLTVIANEQVKEGVCERCDSAVVIQRRPEWAFRITNYSQRLLDNLDKLTGWQPEVVKKQRHWIGRSEGANLQFRVKDSEAVLEVFTTRPDTVFGCTYCVIAPDHPLLDQFVPAERRDAVKAFAEDQARKAAQRGQDEDPPKEGIDTGAVALHPFTGKELPIWAANFVVADYGTGCVMSVPAHDERDFEFAKEFGLPIVPVIRPTDSKGDSDGDAPSEATEAFTDPGILFDSGDFDGLSSAEAKKAIAKAAADGGFGDVAVTYRQRDWGISRQRYWGTPIPIVYCDKCDPDGEGIDVPYDQLPVEIPDIDVEKVLTGRGEPPLAKVPEFVNVTCPSCGAAARREVETMDTFVDSAWYFVRYLDPRNDQLPFAKDIADEWMPLDLYIGGPEHSTMHLLYCRFWCMVMNEMGLLKHEEPVENMVCQGIVNGPDGRKMSKRWGNVIKPANIVDKFGADAARTFVAFAGPPDKDIMWSDEQVEGCNRFLLRLWRLAVGHAESAKTRYDGPFEGEALEIRRIAHKTLKVVTEDIERRSFNTAIARCMEMVNALTGKKADGSDAERAAMAEAVRLLAVMLSPIAPHIGEEIAAAYGSASSLQEQEWPAFDPALVVDDSVTYAVQVNGKLRGQIEMAADADKDAVRAAAEAAENVAGHLEGKTVRKFIFVPKRLVNFVVG